MFFLFSPLGQWLDKTSLNLKGSSRFSEIRKYQMTSLGALGLSFILLFLMIFAIFWVWWSATHPPVAHFFINDVPSYLSNQKLSSDAARGTALLDADKTQKQLSDAGRLNLSDNEPATAMELITSRSPQMSFERVQSWTSRSLMTAYALDFTNYESQLEDSRLLFRSDTYNLFVSQMRGGLLKSLAKNKMIISLTPTSSVRLIDSSEYKKRRMWMLEMKGLIYYDGAFTSRPAPLPVLFRLVVEEVSSDETPYGLVISTISMATL